ncbi:hypothetical protein B0A49_01322 [Cryomyces minteri]|uniref:Uncharacterized protein n=1 Tax=Cryomyces minteri TaxID=331657 RepID=A0A4U0XP31_9PEZI|nr:hypothetical protein B0A49_01322 [Cryomyces minteri]
MVDCASAPGLDTVLDDCFQLVSLFFLTIGRNQEAPAVYSAVSTVKRLLDHLKEAAFYSTKDLDGISNQLRQYENSVERGRADHDANLITLLEARIQICRTLLAELRQALSHLSAEDTGTYETLVSILRSLSACNTRSKYPASEVKAFEDQLKEIQAGLQDVVAPVGDRSAEEQYADKLREMKLDENHVPEGKKLVLDLLARCLLWVQIVREKQGKIDERFQETYEKLREIRNQLDNKIITQAWSMRETDLYSFQRQLDRIDESRVDGNFVDANGKPADLHAQRTLLYLLRKSYANIYHLIIASEPVSEALLPIYNQLQTLKRCLLEVKNSGGLNSIDNMRKDGKFMVGDEIPEGQGSVSELLSQCFELAYELRTAAEDQQSDTDDEVDTPGEEANTPVEEMERKDHDGLELR